MVQRKQKISIKPGKSREPLTITHPNAAGIDIGSSSHYVSVPPDRDDEPVREFPSFTVDLNALADWLDACGVDTVAMESTGVYWIPLFELLESRGFKVFLVNARHVKNVSGRKSDVLDCQWLQQLMTYGLLRGAFRPTEDVCVLRALWRQRGMLLRGQGRQVQHMQKALAQMNVQLANVISDVVGETGQKILRAIVAGERDGQVLAAMKNARIRATAAEIAKSLQGNWRAEHLFALKQALDMFDFIGTQLAECDNKIEGQLQNLQVHDGEPAKGKKRGRTRNAPKFDLRSQLFKMCGVDLTRIDGIDVTTALAVISETGTDMSRFPTAGHFASWLGLCPGTKITGGKVMSGKTKRVANRAAQALRLAAAALRSSQSALGAYFRRMCGRMDKPKAVTAAAHKLARMIYTMLTKGEEYTDQGQDYYEERYRERVLRQLVAEEDRSRFRWLLSGFLNAAYSFFESTALAAHFRFTDADGNPFKDDEGLSILRRHVKVEQRKNDPEYVKTAGVTPLTKQLYEIRRKCTHHFPLSIMVTGASLPEDFHLGNMRGEGTPVMPFCREVLQLIQSIHAEIDW